VTDVANQPTPLEPYNLFTSDPVLSSAVLREGGGSQLAELTAFGAVVGSTEVYEWAAQANRNKPELVTHDRFGEETEARRLIELMAVAWGASLLVQHGDDSVTSLYVKSRLDGNWGSEFGTLAAHPALAPVARRALPGAG
jgi:hypothetical protein